MYYSYLTTLSMFYTLHGTHNCLGVPAKNWQVSVHGEHYANHSQMVQRMFAVPSSHTHIWFACVHWLLRRHPLHTLANEKEGDLFTAAQYKILAEEITDD